MTLSDIRGYFVHFHSFQM